MMQQEDVRDWYRRRIELRTEEMGHRRREDYWLVHLRVATFLLALALAFYGVYFATAAGIWLAAAATLIGGFIVIVRYHEKVLRCIAQLRQRLQINEIQLARLDRRWELVPEHNVDVPPESASLANDLDLFGDASLYQLISQAHTPFGREVLRDWLLNPASPVEIADRQLAISYLAPAGDVREEICLRSRMLSVNEQGTKAFVDWAEAPPVYTARRWLLWSTRLSSLAFVLILVSALAGLIRPGGAVLTMAAITCLHLVIIVSFGGSVQNVLDRVASRSHDMDQYRPLFETIAAMPSEIPLFAALHARMGTTPREPLHLLAKLTRIVRFANLRRDGLFGIPYWLSQFFVLIDFHVVGLMERWQQKHGLAVRRWLEAVGEAEAISSLATLAFDNPHWSSPVVEQAPGATIAARQLGHPLIPEDRCVRNDVEIGPAGTFVLVTGSNMSGKSTLLRAVGLNIVLAQAGAPVCACQLRLPPVDLATSMRTRDSLADGVSFFMAELRRLKQIVDQSRDSQHSSRRCVYLLDEVLQGTNSSERHIAVCHVIGHLVAHGSIGMVSTHDLELARSPILASACRTVHFRESITSHNGSEQMTFDYVLRPGLAATTNALKLLKLVGLDD